jgi:hypothetical protein
VAPDNSIASPAGWYIQYRALLASNDPAITPTIEQVTINYIPQAPETIPPVVEGVTPTGTGVPVNTDITVTFSELIKPATFSAQMNGAGVPADWISDRAYTWGRAGRLRNQRLTHDPGEMA